MTVSASSRRVAAALASAVYLVALFAGPLHLLLVEHVRCAEHGQLVHADQHAREAPASDCDIIVAGSPHADHDHCASSAVTPEPYTAPEPGVLVVGPTDGDGDSSDPTVVALASPWTNERYLLAPKHSPPA